MRTLFQRRECLGKIADNLPHVLAGQVLSLCVSGMSIFTKCLLRVHVKTPSFQMLLLYLSLAVVFNIVRCFLKKSKSAEEMPQASMAKSASLRPSPISMTSSFHQGENMMLSPLSKVSSSEKILFVPSARPIPWWVFVVYGVVDYEANYLATLAYQYGNFVILSLIFSLTIPYVTVLSYFFLRKRYSWNHYAGSCIAFGGCIVIFLGNLVEMDGMVSRELIGNVIAVIASIMYAGLNITQELLVKRNQAQMSNKVEFLAAIGFSGAFMALFQTLVLEGSTLLELPFFSTSSSQKQQQHVMFWYFLGHWFCSFWFYVGIAFFLTVSESLLLNLSLLTADMYVVTASYVLFHESVRSIYWIAISLNICGMFLYTYQRPYAAPRSFSDILSNVEQ